MTRGQVGGDLAADAMTDSDIQRLAALLHRHGIGCRNRDTELARWHQAAAEALAADGVSAGPSPSPEPSLDALRLALTFDPYPNPTDPIKCRWWRLGWLSALAVARDRFAALPSTQADPGCTCEPEQSLDALRALSDAAAPGPWQWLNGGDEHSDELQDGDGEEIARGFREDIELTLNRDGSFAAAAANYVRSLLSETKP